SRVRRRWTRAPSSQHCQREWFIHVVERALPIFQLTPGSQVEGSRTSYKLLSRTTAARRAEHAGAEVPHHPQDLWRIKMHPEPGYISLVSFDSESAVSCA